MKTSNRLTDAQSVWGLAAIFCLGTLPIAKVYPVLYHRLYPAPQYFLGWAIFGLALLLPALVLLGVPATRGIAVKTVFGGLAAYLGLLQLRLRLYDPGAVIPAPVKLLLAVAALGGCCGLIYRYRGANWERLFRAAVAGTVVFAVAPYVYSFGGPGGVRKVSAERFRVAGIDNYLVLILDEFSTEYSQGLDLDLAAQGFHVKRAEVEKAGAHTVTAVPAMLTDQRMDNAAPCSTTRMCGWDAKVVDFRRLEMAEERAHLTGFWHPYCEMRNLDECYRADGLIFGGSLARVIVQEFWCVGYGRLDIFGMCAMVWPDSDSFLGMRTRLDNSIARSAFWKDGGFYLIHYPSPHPKGSGRGKRVLKEEYAENVEEARKLVRDLSGKLRARFGQNFVFVVTTDHPLRMDVWCTEPSYASPDCEKSLVLKQREIPLVVASPSEAVKGLTLPSSNVGLLAGKP